MNLEQQKSLYALLDAAIRLHKMSLIQGDAPFNGHSAIPNSVEDDINCEYCGIINLAEYTLSDIYADIIYDKFIATPAPLEATHVHRGQWCAECYDHRTPAPLDVHVGQHRSEVCLICAAIHDYAATR